MIKRILWDLSFWQNLPQIFNLGLLILPWKFVGRNIKQIQVEGCQPYICAQLQLGANFALTAKYYSPRDTSSASHFMIFRHLVHGVVHKELPSKPIAVSWRARKIFFGIQRTRQHPTEPKRIVGAMRNFEFSRSLVMEKFLPRPSKFTRAPELL